MYRNKEWLIPVFSGSPSSASLTNWKAGMCLRMASFCKKRGCPASQEILEVSNGTLAHERRGAVSEHFCECEFCRAELEFYRHYPQPKGEPEFQEIPQPLLELATSLLDRGRDLTPFYQLMKGRDA